MQGHRSIEVAREADQFSCSTGSVVAWLKRLMGEGYSKLLPFIGIWILISLFFGIFGMPGTGAAIAWTTHIGGFIAGLLLYRPIAKMNMR